jgi:hypothetical protein
MKTSRTGRSTNDLSVTNRRTKTGILTKSMTLDVYGGSNMKTYFIVAILFILLALYGLSGTIQEVQNDLHDQKARVQTIIDKI